MDYPKRYDKDGFPDDDGCYADAYETTDEITRLTAENAELRSGIVTTETLCFSHEGRIENLMKENAALRKKDGYIEDLEGTIDGLRAENAALREWGENAHRWLRDHRELELSGKSAWVEGLINGYPGRAALDAEIIETEQLRKS